MTREPHLAGTPADLKTAEYVRDRWLEQGLGVEIVPYDVLLSYPEDNHNNTVSIVEADGSVSFASTQLGDVLVTLAPDQREGVQPYNAYSPSGSPQAELVYANYGRQTDFDKLKELGIDCTGRIVIARYAKNFRGDKAKAAQAAGAVGLILYSDPADVLPPGFSDNTTVFPDDWWMPPSGVQRGGISVLKGDPTTPGYPSTYGTSLFLGDDVALQSSIGGPEAPADFVGGLDITYRLGPQMQDNKKVNMDVRNIKTMRTTYNVIGKIEGRDEPDRYVLMGNHRDAWVQGAVDPTSGTATMLEITRAMGKLMTTGWRPRRTILYCSWGAEEFGMVGSVEWVEENLRVLDKRAIAYLNIDSSVMGNATFFARAVPLLRDVVLSATQQVPDPLNSSRTVYDTWIRNIFDFDRRRPALRIPGSGSDFHPFLLQAGIPVTDTIYLWPVRKYRLSVYPLYHTSYDLFSQMKFVDRDFRVHAAMAKVNLVMLMDLADSPIIPFNVTEYAVSIVGFVENLKTTYESLPGFIQRGINFGNATFFARAVPLLRDVVLSATQQVPDPLNSSRTVYDTWIRNIFDFDRRRPALRIPGSGSDFHPFLLQAGIPVTDTIYLWPVRKYRLSVYPLYHTSYDLFSQMKFVDRDFRVHAAMAKVNLVMLMDLADSPIIPFNVTEYAVSIVGFVENLKTTYESLPGFIQRGINFGNATFFARAVPLLRDVVLSATQQVPDPLNSSRTVYDTWIRNIFDFDRRRPALRIPGSGSDFHPFLLQAGIPVTDTIYLWPVRKYRLSVYPLYHTSYDLFSQMKFVDRDFRVHAAMAKVNLVMLMDLADSPIIPFNVTEYAVSIVGFVENLKTTYESLPGFIQRGINFDSAMSAAVNFTKAAENFHMKLKRARTYNALEVRMINDLMMAVERMFLDPGGLPGRPVFKHMVFAPALTNTYSGVLFPGISDLLFRLDPNDEARWDDVKKHVTVITYAIQSAANLVGSYSEVNKKIYRD